MLWKEALDCEHAQLRSASLTFFMSINKKDSTKLKHFKKSLICVVYGEEAGLTLKDLNIQGVLK